MLARDPFSKASSTIDFNISAVKGSFLLIGLARDLLRPSNTAWMKGSVVGDGNPAMEWAHDIALLTSELTIGLLTIHLGEDEGRSCIHCTADYNLDALIKTHSTNTKGASTESPLSNV